MHYAGGHKSEALAVNIKTMRVAETVKCEPAIHVLNPFRKLSSIETHSMESRLIYLWGIPIALALLHLYLRSPIAAEEGEVWGAAK